MSYGKKIHQYRKNSITSASPLQLVIMLYDASIRFIEDGKKAIIEKDHYTQNYSLQKAQNIVMELISSLNMDKGKDISSNLYSIYLFIYESLIEANVNVDQELLNRCQNILCELRESWSEIERQQRGSTIEVQQHNGADDQSKERSVV